MKTQSIEFEIIFQDETPILYRAVLPCWDGSRPEYLRSPPKETKELAESDLQRILHSYCK